MQSSEPAEHPKNLRLLVLGALGVVYGDVGTSPLYALRECFTGSHDLPPSAENVLGVLSLIFWSLAVVVSVKYMVVVMRADNQGEGGILALMALALSGSGDRDSLRKRGIIAVGLFGAALLYGDGMITPAISVLSAVEGIEVVTPFVAPYVVPATVVILLLLFLVQRHGTGRIGSYFGPVVLLWFSTIGILGLVSILHTPSVLAALNPWYGVQFFVHNGVYGFLVLSAVFLVLTGAEALYADMGHFGRRPIQMGWYGIALPGLVLNYFGQGALVLSSPAAVANPFYSLAPRWALIPLVLLATAATIIASQAMITGAFSLTRQAVLLGYLPRVKIIHTSSAAIGQIYVPIVNRFLLVSTIALVFGFRSSSNLAAAYGVAVTMTMVITTVLLYVVVKELWHWPAAWVRLMVGAFLVIDLAFCTAALTKIPEGGIFPLLVAALIYAVMSTWRKGRLVLRDRLQQQGVSLEAFIAGVTGPESSATRVPGASIFMAGNPENTPLALLHNIKYNRVLHEQVVIMNVTVAGTPHVSSEERLQLEDLGHGFYRVRAKYGFMESSNVNEILELCAARGLEINMFNTGFFLGREIIRITRNPRISMWRQRLFALISQNAQGATPFFEIPPNQVIELGVRLQL